MKTKRILSVIGVMCTLLASVALAAVDAEDVRLGSVDCSEGECVAPRGVNAPLLGGAFLGVLGLGAANIGGNIGGNIRGGAAGFGEFAPVSYAGDGILPGIDALADGSVVVYDGTNLFKRPADGTTFQDVGDFNGGGSNAVYSAGFVAAAPNGGALIGAADGTMMWLDGSELVVTGGPTDGVVFGEFVGATKVLVSSGAELGLVTWNSGALTASYTAVVDYNTSSMAPTGIVLVDDTVYVGDVSGTIRSFALADLEAVTDTPLDANDAPAFYENREIGQNFGPNAFGPYGILGPTDVTPDGNLLVGGVGIIEVVQPEGGFLRRNGRVLKTAEFVDPALMYLPISTDGTVVVADSAGNIQEADFADPGFFGKLFAPIVQLFQWLFGLITGLFSFGA